MNDNIIENEEGNLCVPLSPNDRVNYQLPFGYQIVANEGEIMPADDESQMDILISKHLELLKNGDVVYSASISTDNINPKTTFEAVKSYLLKNEGEDKTNWMRVKVCGEEVEKPPWERHKATRNIKRYTADSILNTLNDEGNAARFIEEANGYLIYDPDRGERNKGGWYAWLDNHWEPANEKIGQTERFIGKSIEEELRYWERQQELNSDNKKKMDMVVSSLRTHAAQSKNSYRQEAMTKMVRKSTMRVNLDEMVDYHILAYKNGAIDTKTGDMYEIWECDKLKERYPTTFVDASYISGADPKKFKQHVHTIFYDNTTANLTDEERERRAEESERYFYRQLGYMLYAGNPENIMVFWWGEGANGKSITMAVISDILGEQHSEAPISELMVKNVGRPAPKTAGGLSKRCLTFSEASAGGDGKDNSLSSSQIKTLTGERKTNHFRKMYEEGDNVWVNCLPIGITNNLPKFDESMDYAQLRRMQMLSFHHRFEGVERNNNILDELLAEKDEIFSLMVDELRNYLKEGLVPVPHGCRVVFEELLSGYEYRLFVTTQYEKTNGEKTEDRTSRNEVKTSFIEWCGENMIDIDTTMKIWGVDNYGYPQKRRALTNGEAAKLYNAFKVCGIREGKSEGKRYFCCRRKTNT